jgi:peptide/nickel transport system permease protein
MLRGSLLDELRKQYVITARAKGVAERRLLFKYPVRLAMNPLISSLPWVFPRIISGSTIVAVVLNLPTTGPMLLEALMNQDMYLAGTLIMFLTFLAIVGTFVADLILVAVDPRIRVEQRAVA